MPRHNPDLPIVYSCSGCSSAAQMANYLAIQLDRRRLAEMSCIAGVGGNVPALVRIAGSGRAILALDGCAHQCARHCLRQRGLEPTHHVQLQEHGIKKRYGDDFDHTVADQLFENTLCDLARGLKTEREQAPPPTDSHSQRHAYKPEPDR